MFPGEPSSSYLAIMGSLWLAVLASLAYLARAAPWRRDRGGARSAATILVVLTATLVAALLCESAFALLYDGTDDFSMSKVSRRWNGRHVHLNNWGFRDQAEFQMTRAPGTTRIALLGDSFTFGNGIADPLDRYGDLVRARLVRTHEIPIELYNLARPGFSTRDQVKLLEDLDEDGFEADVVLVGYVLNDADYVVSDQMGEIVSEIMALQPRSRLLTELYLPNFLYLRWTAVTHRKWPEYRDLLNTAYEGRLWDEHVRTLDRLVDWCDGRGVALVFIVMPFLNELGSRYPFARPHAALNRYLTEKGVEHVDLLETIQAHHDEGLVVSPFDAHPNERAHALIAGTVWDTVSPLVAALDRRGRESQPR